MLKEQYTGRNEPVTEDKRCGTLQRGEPATVQFTEQAWLEQTGAGRGRD